MLNNRCIEILKYLIKNNESKNVEELSNKFNISKRMIRYDIDSINEFLRENNLSEIEKKANSPLGINYEDKDKIQRILASLDRENYILSNEERVGIIIYDLLRTKNECTYLRLQRLIDISKSTLVSDLKKVKEWLLDFNITMVKFSNKGIIVKGDEIDIRKAMTTVLIGNNKYNILQTLEKIYCSENNSIINEVKSLQYSSDKIEYIKELVIDLEDELGIFTDEDFRNIVFTVFVIITRSKDFKINKQDFTLEKQYKREYKAAEKIAIKILDKFGISINSEDLTYLTSMIVSISKNSNDFLDSKEYFLACSIANEICNNASELYETNIKIDNKLYESFINHIKGLIFRLKFRLDTKNDIISTIKSTYSEDFVVVKKSCEFLEEKFNYKLSDDEIGFITLYICAAKEKSKGVAVESRKNILIVCSQGFATGRILEMKVKRYFDVNIIAVTAVHAIKKYLDNKDVDIIISTLKIDDDLKVPNIVVSPIFKENDIEILKKYLKYKKMNNIEVISEDNAKIIDSIYEVIYRNCEIIKHEELIQELNTLFNVNSTNSFNYKKET